MATSHHSTPNELWQVSPTLAEAAIPSKAGRAAQRARLLARALRDTGLRVRGEDSTLAGYLNVGAARMDDLASYLSSVTLSTLTRDTQRLARERPIWFFAGTFFLGFAAGGLVRGSSRTKESKAKVPAAIAS